MPYTDPDDLQTRHYTARGAGQKYQVPQTMLTEGYDNNHAKFNARTSAPFSNDSNDKAMRHTERFTRTYASAGSMNRSGRLRFVSNNDER